MVRCVRISQGIRNKGIREGVKIEKWQPHSWGACAKARRRTVEAGEFEQGTYQENAVHWSANNVATATTKKEH